MRSSHASPRVAARHTSWSSSDRFATKCGWMNEKSRDDSRLAALLGGDDAPGSAKVPDGRSRFVVSRPEASLAGPRSAPGTVCSKVSTAEGPGLISSMLKVPGKFVIRPRDAEGRPVIASYADVFRIHIVGLEAPKHTVVEEDDGALSVRWLPLGACHHRAAAAIARRGRHRAAAAIARRGRHRAAASIARCARHRTLRRCRRSL